MKFTTAAVISAATGKLVCPIDRLYAIYNYLTGDNLFTHQLPRAYRACDSWVKEQCPWTQELNVDLCNRDNWQAWLADAEQKYGAEHELAPLPAGIWQSCDPIQEAIELMEDKSKVVVVAR